MSKPLPDNPADSIGLSIQLKPDALPQHVNAFGKQPYVITRSTANANIPGITEEELLRVVPYDEYGKPGARAHALLFGKGLYARLQTLFEVI